MYKNRTALSTIMVTILAVSIIPAVNAKNQTDQFARVRAAFVYNISKFVTWPDLNLKTQNDPFKICIMTHGDEELVQQFAGLKSKKTQGRAIQVNAFGNKKQLSRSTEIEGPCHILFTPNGEWSELTQSEISTLRKSTLLIGKTRNFLEQGGMLSLIQTKSKIEIYINPESMDQSRIKLESRLRSLAKIL